MFCMLMTYISLNGSFLNQSVAPACTREIVHAVHSSCEYFSNHARLPKRIHFSYVAMKRKKHDYYVGKLHNKASQIPFVLFSATIFLFVCSQTL